MRRLNIHFIIIIALILCTLNAYAYKERKDYFSRPQIGGWFGPVTPLGDLSDPMGLKTALGGGIFFRFTLPYQYLKFGIDSSYQHYKSNGINEMHFVPVYGNLLFQLPIKFPIRFQFKAGLGTGYLYVLPSKKEQWDLIFMTGVEVSFPAGRIVNIGLRVDYINIFEKYMKDAEINGHILNIGIMLYFNI